MISIYLQEKLSDELITSVLKKGESLSLKYYDYDWDDKFINPPKLGVEKALLRIKEKDDKSIVRCKFQDTLFYFSFHEDEDGGCSIGLWDAGYSWKKEFSNGQETVEFDLQRYIRLLLQLVEGLHIKKLEAKIEWD